MKPNNQGRIVHCKREPYDVYIGRPGPWGNPHTIQSCGTRAEAIRRYESDLRIWLEDPAYKVRFLEALAGKTLGCWCHPLPCHGDVILREIQRLTNATGEAEHTCHAIGCSVEVPPRLLMCLTHWRMVPRPLQAAVWENYRPGQENDKNPTPQYLAAARAAIEAVAKSERPAQQPSQPRSLFHEDDLDALDASRKTNCR